MEDKVQVKLLEDIYSGGKGKVVYGLKNETVSLVSVMDEILIVENNNKNRFPVKANMTNYNQ